jgi:hypothetical protein
LGKSSFSKISFEALTEDLYTGKPERSHNFPCSCRIGENPALANLAKLIIFKNLLLTSSCFANGNKSSSVPNE